MGGTWNSTWVREVPPLLLWMRGTHHHRPQTTCSYVQKRCGHSITVYTMYHVKISPIYGPDLIQTWPRNFHCRLAIKKNHVEGKDKPIKDMDVWVDAIQSSVDMPECISIEEIQHVSSTDVHLQQLRTFIIAGWPHTKDELHTDIRPYWPYRAKLAVIYGVILKGRHIIIPDSLKQQVLAQLHTNHMGIEKTKLLACESVFWHNINSNIEAYIKIVLHVLNSSRHSQKKK